MEGDLNDEGEPGDFLLNWLEELCDDFRVFPDFEVYLKTKIDKASQIDPMMMIGKGGSEKGYPMLHHHYLHHRAPHHQFGQQPLHPGFVLPPKYLSKEEYSSVKSIDDSRASVYFTPRTNGTQPGALTEDENLSQKSIQGTPIHINYLSESLDIPEDMQMMYHEMKPLARGDDARHSQRVASSGRNGVKKRSRDEDDGHWSQNPNRLCGGGGEDINCDITAAEEMMMRMNFGRFGNLDEDTSEILMHELIQKKLKRDRRNRMRFYDERKRRQRQEEQRRSKGVGGNVVADQGPMEGNSLGGGGMMGIPALKSGNGRSRRPVMASAMDPEFLRLMNGGNEGLPIGYDTDQRRRRRDFHRPVRVTIVDEEPVPGGSGVNQQQQKKRASGVGVEKADILYHSLGPEKEARTGVVKVAVEKPSKAAAVNFNAWPLVRRTDNCEEEEGEDDDDEMCFGDRFAQRQMFTSKSLPEISRKRGKRRNKDQVGEAGDKEEAGGAGIALLGTSDGAAATSSIQMTTVTDECKIEVEGKSAKTNEQQTGTANSNSTANNNRLIHCVKKNHERNDNEGGDGSGRERPFNGGQERDLVLNGNVAEELLTEESIRNGGMK